MNGLQFNVAGLLKENAGATRDYDVDAAPEDLAGLLEEARPAAPLRGHLRLLRTQRSIFVRGRLHTTVQVDCSRCLTEMEVPLSFEVEDEFFPEIDIATGHPLPRPDDDGLGFMINANHELDLRESVRQHLLLELPLQAICRETCAGLCPRCGVDLNTGECACAEEDIDDRLAPLRALFEQTGRP
jgi:uncharacterized protein